MDNPTCLGCGHNFATQKKLHSHKPWCEAHDEYTADVFRSQKCLQRGCKVGRNLIPQHSEASGGNDPVETQVDNQPTPMVELQVCLLFLTDE